MRISDQILTHPINIGPLRLIHRVVMAPLTRSRSTQPGDIPGSLMSEYYAQRASPGGLIISEATTISPAGRGWQGSPGIYTPEQVAGWRTITDAVHRKGGFLFAQLWHVGRSSNVVMTGGATPVSASVNPSYWENAQPSVSTPQGWLRPSPHRALKSHEIPAVVIEYVDAAKRALDAGFDGVELHAANGYLPDQFLQDGSNHRTDDYGGSVENRSRFMLEVVEGLISVWGANRTAVRIAPGGRWNKMADSNAWALFCHIATQLDRLKLAYLHVIEPRVNGSEVIAEGEPAIAVEKLRKSFSGRIIAAGGFEPASAEAVVRSGSADLVAFGRHFIANPDLPLRIERGYPLAPHDRATFYTFDSKGYTDYPRYEPSGAEPPTRS